MVTSMAVIPKRFRRKPPQMKGEHPLALMDVYGEHFDDDLHVMLKIQETWIDEPREIRALADYLKRVSDYLDMCERYGSV